MLERFFAVVDPAVDRFGGVIDKHIGDAAMALFGAPLAHGDDALRAVRAALEIQSAVSGTFSAGTEPLSVHVGLALGEVVASSVGSDRHRGSTVTGEAANVAARLLDRAGAGETFVSDEIYRATSHAADYETVGRHSLKGKLKLPVILTTQGETMFGCPHRRKKPWRCSSRCRMPRSESLRVAQDRTAHRIDTIALGARPDWIQNRRCLLCQPPPQAVYVAFLCRQTCSEGCRIRVIL